ncbi:hypothetical protein GOODEAATRI_019162, partial [Goodea atripinnis]
MRRHHSRALTRSTFLLVSGSGTDFPLCCGRCGLTAGLLTGIGEGSPLCRASL